ncbi:MAG TPA: hypothetical protein VD927_04300, partial [Chryseosolibacter sp.]|nr:hypothetical protein [Chryseosolibacter sp.]
KYFSNPLIQRFCPRPGAYALLLFSSLGRKDKASEALNKVAAKVRKGEAAVWIVLALTITRPRI